MIVIVAPVIAAITWFAGEARYTKIGVEIRCGRGAVVVAGCQAVGYVGRVEDIPGGVGIRPLRGVGSNIDVITQAGNVDNILGCLVVYNPVHLGVINGWIGGGVILGVGDGDESEVGSRRRLKRTPIEGDVERLISGSVTVTESLIVVGTLEAPFEGDQNRRFRREIDRGVERRARHPVGARPGDRAVDRVAGGIVHSCPGGFIESPAATRPVCGSGSLVLMVLMICACVRATFQIRTSSRTPSKKPNGVLSVFIEVPNASWEVSPH